jgi:hypothetical protein
MVEILCLQGKGGFSFEINSPGIYENAAECPAVPVLMGWAGMNATFSKTR